LSCHALLAALDNEQKEAVTLKTNGVAVAGAGSGKTKVLASRYVWLVMEENLKPEEILTLTFTNKAVSEMYNRIYSYLLEQSNPGSPDEKPEAKRAEEALKNFHKARISTLDSFSAAIARTAAARYGISPDFKSDDNSLRDLAREAALGFVLNHREAPAISWLLADNKVKAIAEKIFAKVVLNYSPVSSPLKFDDNLAVQKEALLLAWQEKIKLAEKITGCMVEALHGLNTGNKSIGFTESLGEVLLKNPSPPPPDIAPLLETGKVSMDIGKDDDLLLSGTRAGVKKYFDYYSTVIAIHLPGRYREEFSPVVEYFRLLKGKDKDGIYHELESIANYALNFSLCAGVFELLEKFQNEFNRKKRESGYLSFNDIAHLALDALKDHPDIRKVHKDSLKMIMIDEFQDNNALQRDLVYLLAENPGRIAKGIAAPGELENNRMFFVGDEKQSIYRFRGADVAVFRSLGRTIDPSDQLNMRGNKIIELVHNYRSQPALIAVFNRIFGGIDSSRGRNAPATGQLKSVFLPPGPKVPDYEAAYRQISPPEKMEEKKEHLHDGPLAHFCFLDGEELSGEDVEGIKSQELEAVFIAKKIRDMIKNGETIPKRKDEGIVWEQCEWGDFAVLERSYTHQGILEKYFRELGVPYNTDRPSGLFNDAPILDLRAFLRLLVYPEDRIAYAALIRSPFMRLSDLSLSVCMLSKNPEPFAEENEALIPEDDIELYRQARERYRTMCEAGRTLPVAELITKLWFEEGYRCETLWSESAQVYESLFDLFFSLASESDAQGKSLAEFIEYLEDVMNREERPDDRDIPGEGEPGVRIMSIHKSKGLEFPVVFIFDSAHSGNISRSSGLISFHEKFGLIMNIPQAEELPLGGNYFRKILSDEEKSKDIAELRRLLYVAMTRSEYRLFLTFTLPRQTLKEKKEWEACNEEFNEETIRRRLCQLDEKSGDNPGTFLELLAGVLPGCPASLCTLEAIPILSRAEIYRLHHFQGANERTSGISVKNQREAALAAAPYYENAKVLPEGKAWPAGLEASKLRYKKVSGTIFEKTILNPADFGSLVHSILEDRLNKRNVLIPPKIRSLLEDDEKACKQIIATAEAMADTFISSDLGKRWVDAVRRESEFPVITSVDIEGRSIAIAGQIDLLFEEDDQVVVVDFKTDRSENPEDHYGQMTAYCRAAGDIFAKPVSVWLYYLRSGRAVNITREVQTLSLEDLATTAWNN